MSESTKQTNAEFAATNAKFKNACAEAGIPATKRQAGKWRRKTGRAHVNLGSSRRRLEFDIQALRSELYLDAQPEHDAELEKMRQARIHELNNKLTPLVARLEMLR